MPRRRREQLRALADEVARRFPGIDEPSAAVVAGHVLVEGVVRTNPASLIRAGASITLRDASVLRGTEKLRAALAHFEVDVRGLVAVDVGAAAGGFTQALLEAGASRVYAVDVGHGQLRGFLRQDARVVSLERTNLSDLDRTLIADRVDVFTLDLSYLALHSAAPQLERVGIHASAIALALVKPQFELALSQPPTTQRELEAAVARATDGFAAAGWEIIGVMESPVRGAGGSIEFFLHARRLRSLT